MRACARVCVRVRACVSLWARRVHVYHGSAGLVVAREGLELALDDHGVHL